MWHTKAIKILYSWGIKKQMKKIMIKLDHLVGMHWTHFPIIVVIPQHNLSFLLITGRTNSNPKWNHEEQDKRFHYFLILNDLPQCILFYLYESLYVT
jgi:hypothetical protein